MSAVKAASSSDVLRRRLCVARGCPTTVQARRSETGSRERTCATHARFREGLSISPEGFLQDQLVERQLRHRPLEPAVLLLHFLEALGLVELQTAVLAPPAIIALVRCPRANGRRGFH